MEGGVIRFRFSGRETNAHTISGEAGNHCDRSSMWMPIVCVRCRFDMATQEKGAGVPRVTDLQVDPQQGEKIGTE